MEENYIAVKTDIIRSRKIPHRAQVQEKFLEAVEQVNIRFNIHLAARFIVTHGDEAQGLVKSSSAKILFDIVEFMVEAMSPVKLRFGLGYGGLSTKLMEDAIGMDGEAWQNAKEALEDSRVTHHPVRLRGFDGKLEKGIESLANLLLWIHSHWTKEQMQAIVLIRDNYKQREAAKKLRVSEVAVSKRLHAAGWRQYSEGKMALKSLLPLAVPTGRV